MLQGAARTRILRTVQQRGYVSVGNAGVHKELTKSFE